MSAKEFDDWWNEQGELQASFCGGSIPAFARIVWNAAIGPKEQNSDSEQQLKAKIPQNIMERLEAVQCIVASPCDAEEAHCAWGELDNIIAELSAI